MLHVSPRRTKFMAWEKVAGALHKPNPIRRNTNRPYRAMNAVFFRSLGLIITWWEAEFASSFENQMFPDNVSKHSSISGRGYTSFLVTLFNRR